MTTLITRYKKLQKTIENLPENTVVVIERSVYSDYEIFAKLLGENFKIEGVMLIIYEKYFNEFKTLFELNKTIYLKTTPQICYDRRHFRAREGEELISLNYLEQLHEKHEKFYESFLSKYESIIIDGTIDINDSQYDENINNIIDFISN